MPMNRPSTLRVVTQGAPAHRRRALLPYLVLGVLADGPRHGYELKSRFEEFVCGTWPLNVAQLYAVLSALERDGLVSHEVVAGTSAPARKVYALTRGGRAELASWLDEPAPGPVRLRDELALKMLVGARVGGEDPPSLIAAQREESLRALAEVQRALAAPDLERATSLLLEAAALRLDADLRWLDVCEQRWSEHT